MLYAGLLGNNWASQKLQRLGAYCSADEHPVGDILAVLLNHGCSSIGGAFGIQPIVTEMPEVTLNPNNIIDLFYFEVSQLILNDAGQITLEGQMKALVFICVFVVVTFFLKNLFRYLALFFSAPLKNGVVRDIRNRIYHKVVNLSSRLLL